jgi:nucleotide-binding universal stress UspA family protein
MSPLRQILWATDLSSEADRALDHARFLAQRFEATLELYHAVSVPDHRFAHWAFAHGHEIWADAERHARECLARRAAALSVQHRVVVERSASVTRSLLDHIRDTQPDLTVLANHGRSGLAHLLLGSVSEEVVQHVFRPVLWVREPDHGPALPYRRLLVPSDFSLASRLAFPMAALLARAFGAEVLALHVADPRTHAWPEGAEGPTTEAAVRNLVAENFAGLELRPLVRAGPVWATIVEVARQERADLVVMATRGHDSVADRVLGSNTERVIRHGPCPVLVA